MNKILISILSITLQICSPAFAQTYIKGPALIEGVTSTATAAGTTTLTKDSQTIQVFTGSTTQTVVLPDATTLPVGRPFEFYNLSSGAITVNANGGTLQRTLLASDHSKITLTNNSTSTGTWAVEKITISLTDSLLTGTLPIVKGGTNSGATLNNNRVIQSLGGALVEASAITGSRALVSDSNGIPTHSTATTTEVGYLSGVTSALQTQLDAKSTKALASGHIFVGNGSNIATDVSVTGDIAITSAGVTSYSGTVPLNKGGTGTAAASANAAFNALSPMTTGGDLIYGGASGAATRLANGTSGQFLKSNGTTLAPSWGDAALTAQGQDEGSGVTTTTVKVPYNQFTTTGTGERLVETGNGNLLLNPSFEHSTYSTGWGALGSTTPAVEPTVIRHGKKSAKLTLAAQSGLFWFQSVTPTIQMTGMTMEHGIAAKTPVATTGASVCALNAGSVVGTCTNLINDNVWHYYPINYPGPASGSVGVGLYSASGTTGDIYVDDAYVGTARNIGTVQQAYNFGTIRQDGATGCGHSVATTSETTWNALGAGTGCATITPTGSLSNSSANTLQATLTNGAAGSYKFTLATFFNSSTASLVCNFRLTDGTTPFGSLTVYHSNGNNSGGPLVGTLNVASAFSSKTVYVEVSGSNTNTCRTLADGAGRMTEWSVEYSPSASQTAVRMDQSNYDAAPCTVTGSWVSNTTYSCLESRQGSWATYDILVLTSGNPTAANLAINLPSGRVIDTTKLSGITQGTVFESSGGAIDLAATFYDAKAVYTSTTSFTVTAFNSSAAATTQTYVSSTNPFTFASGDFVNIKVKVPIVGWSSNQNAPLLVGGVTSRSTGLSILEGATVTGSSGAISSSSSSWITFVRNSAGNYTGTFNPVFSAAPWCVVTNSVGSTSMGLASTDSISASSIRVLTSQNSFTTQADANFQILCMGPR